VDTSGHVNEQFYVPNAISDMASLDSPDSPPSRSHGPRAGRLVLIYSGSVVFQYTRQRHGRKPGQLN